MSERSDVRQEQLAPIQLTAQRGLDGVTLVLDHLRNIWNLDATLQTCEGQRTGRVSIVGEVPAVIYPGISFKAYRRLRLKEYQVTKTRFSTLRGRASA